MCGIFATTGGATPRYDLKHRGPDMTSELIIKNMHLMFWRLAINGVTDGMQPLEYHGKYLIANAEIYNHIELGGVYGKSDCQVILNLVEDIGLYNACNDLDGDFAFVLTDGDNIWAARDRVGVRPLFYCRHKDGIAFASEAKALLHFPSRIEIFPPGHLYDSRIDQFVCWEPNYFEKNTSNPSSIVDYMYRAVSKRVTNTERPIGFFLSGGLDSSIVAAIGKRLSNTRIKTFSIGMEGSPDLLAARKMANFLDSDHTEVLFTPEEGLEAINDVIWHLESFDTTTVRAAIPMYMLSKYFKEHLEFRIH